MECPECKTHNPDGHKFCGSCGHELTGAPSQAQRAGPPLDKFCAQCGSTLPMIGTITIANSGLIIFVDENALHMLGYEQSDMHGKPFSLFVENTDLVIFFSHLNELLSSAKNRSFEIALKHKEKDNFYVQLECKADQHTSESPNTIRISFTENTDSHIAASRMQTQQDLLSLIFAITDNISTVNQEHLARSIEDALKSICLFTKADRCFIYSINRPSFRLEPVYEWRQPLATLQGVKVKSKIVSLSKLKLTMARLRQEKVIVIHDTTKMNKPERNELLDWLHVDEGAFICHAIYSEKLPIGIIGAFKNAVIGEWEQDSVALVKFFGDFIANHLPTPGIDLKGADKAQTASALSQKTGKKLLASSPGNVVDMSDIDPSLDDEFKTTSLEPVTSESKKAGMRLEKYSGAQPMYKESVFERGDGLVLLNCPHCGLQESVAAAQFDTLGSAVHVRCSCKKQFLASLEKRYFFRKQVRFEGYFSLNEELGPTSATSNTWGPMIVNDLSKTGLQFSSEKAKFLHPGNLLMVRFNLDNANQALIHKPARVISVTGKEVRCKFVGADSYDITLGFYFM